MLNNKILYITSDTPGENAVATLKALGAEPRWSILQLLAEGDRSVNEIAELLAIAPSTAAAHIKILEEAGLIRTELQRASHGLQKVCARTYDSLHVQLPQSRQVGTKSVEISMPVGSYTKCDVSPTCGLASETALIGYIDDPVSFYEPERSSAGLIWFTTGYLEYAFPNRLPESALPTSLIVSMEICSEAPMHNEKWPSDITLWINGREVGTWTSPGDLGGRRGRLTPLWWNTNETQYGLLKRWMVNGDGAYVDGYPVSGLTIDQLDIDKERLITVRLGVKPDALHAGGVNLFGRSYGNYPQDLMLYLEYKPGQHWIEKQFAGEVG